jgi:hypothetical protein
MISLSLGKPVRFLGFRVIDIVCKNPITPWYHFSMRLTHDGALGIVLGNHTLIISYGE